MGSEICIRDSDWMLPIKPGHYPAQQGYFAGYNEHILLIFKDGNRISPEIKPMEYFSAMAERRKYEDNFSLPPDSLRQVVETPEYRFTIYYRQIGGFQYDSNGVVLIKEKAGE